MKRIFKLLVIVLSVFLLSGCETETKDKLTMVTEAGFHPYEYYSNGEIVGVDVDIVKRIAEYLDLELEVKDVHFDSIISEVRSGKSDIGAAGISYTEERALQVAFTDNYITSNQVIITKVDSDITNKDTLHGKVAVQLGTIADSYITDELPSIELVRENKFLACIEDLRQGKVDAVVMDELPAINLIDNTMVILDEPLISDSYGMVVALDNTSLLNAANAVIKKMKDSGEIDAILLKHLNTEEDKQNVKEEKTSNIFTKIGDRFYRSVIVDGRYKFIITGFKNTLLIALGSVIVGIILGTILALIGNFHDNTGKLRLLNRLAKLYIDIIRGTPSTLQLMIIYYIIFGSQSVNMLVVGIMAFGINSSAYVAEIIRSGLKSIDKGQLEAGYALSLNYGQVMRYIVFPQAIKNILPTLGNEFITLVKETSIGAYIGIIELTKASDIIASRTYDYFFPLILIALIYLVITFTLSKLVSLMEKRLKNA
ncbi:MAG: ABC transporter substrate-binding protein/permease [Bacilli bacterium]|nr:ABC transporter substrate-binding protein/permease [Bacilli bacterium]